MLVIKKGKIKLSEFNWNFYAWEFFLGREKKNYQTSDSAEKEKRKKVFGLSVLKKTFSELLIFNRGHREGNYGMIMS